MAVIDFLRRRRRMVKKEAGGSRDPLGILRVSSSETPTASRPVDLFIPVAWSASQAFPYYTMGFRLAYLLAYQSDILRSVLRALIGEVFRNGVEVRRRYYKKCPVCGTTYDYDVPVCEVCGNSDLWIYPDERNRRYLEKWIEHANDNHENLIDVLSAIEWDLDTTDNAYLIVRKRYYFNEEGEIVRAEPLEVLRGDPRWIMLIMSRDGRLGYSDEGDRIYFTCPVHRHVIVDKPVKEYEEDGAPRCPVCGRKMVKAVASWNAPNSQKHYYIEGEIIHVKKYTYGIGYGFPPVYSLWLKLIVLLRMDYFILLSFMMERSPKGVLVIQGVNAEQVERAWRYYMEKARINPYIVYPLVIEQAPERGDVVRWLDISLKSDVIDYQAYRDEVRRQIMAFYGVTPVFMGENVGGGRGVMQILVTNRAIEMAQRVFNDKILPWLTKQLGVEDWVLQLRPSELRDEERKIRILSQKLDLAQKLAALGYKPKVIQRGGEIDITFVPAESGELSEAESVLGAKPKKRGGSGSKRQAARERYYEQREAENYLQGMPSSENPRAGRQRLEGEPMAPHEAVEGAPEGTEEGGA